MTLEQDLAFLKLIAIDVEKRLAHQPSMAGAFGAYQRQVDVAAQILSSARENASKDRKEQLIASVKEQRKRLAELLLNTRVGAVQMRIKDDRARLEGMRKLR